MKYEEQPTAEEIASIAYGASFPTGGCILACRHTVVSCSATADHQVWELPVVERLRLQKNFF